MPACTADHGVDKHAAGFGQNPAIEPGGTSTPQRAACARSRRVVLEVVIFDLDGLLVDSEPLQFRAYQKAFADCGIAFAAADWPRWHRLEASASRWVEVHGLNVDPEEIRARKKILYDALVAGELALKPGARRLVETLAGTYRLCVASGSRPESIRSCLDRFSLTRYFEKQFSATLLARKKPYPDVYLQALTNMRVPGRNTLAIEDSLTGLQAASAAGIKCIVCPDNFLPLSNEQFHAAARVVDSLDELSPRVLEKIAAEQTGN